MFPQSVLAAMFSGRWESSLERDPQGNYFLDFDAADFAILLTYLRYYYINELYDLALQLLQSRASNQMKMNPRRNKKSGVKR